MTWPPCGQTGCPVAEPTGALLRKVHSTTVGPGRTWWRGSRHPADTLAPAGAGATRFAPLPDTRHGYFGATKTVALLESALHEASGPHPTIYLARLAAYRIGEVELTTELRLADLRDGELSRLGAVRDALVDTTPEHYPCTRRWAEHLQGRRGVGGILWHSRQADLHRRSNPGGLFAEVLVHTPAEIAVVWCPPAPDDVFDVAGPSEALVIAGGPSRLVTELSVLIGAPVE